MNPVFFWLAALVILVAVEIATMGLTSIWFAGGALVAVFAAMADLSFKAQAIVFLVVSLVLQICTRPLAMKYFNRERVKTNVDSIVGKQAIVLTEINNLREQGQVSLNGMEWSARAYEESAVIPAGAVVIVKEISGVKLIVEEKEKEQ